MNVYGTADKKQPVKHLCIWKRGRKERGTECKRKEGEERVEVKEGRDRQDENGRGRVGKKE